MTQYEAERILKGAAREGLPELSIENLKCGRITRQTMELCFKRWRLLNQPRASLTTFDTTPSQDLYFADWLNDLLEAGRVVWAAERVKVCADAMKDNDNAKIL